MNGKKGFVFTGIIALFLIGVMVTIGFLFSNKIRWVLFGVGAMVGAIYLLSKLDNNKQANKVKLTFAIILFIGALVLIFASGIIQSQFSFTPVYCNDYSFTCCVEKLESTRTYPIDRATPFICPTSAEKCEISSSVGSFYVGDSNCRYSLGIRYPSIVTVGFSYWHCDNDVKHNSPYVVYPGDYVNVDDIFETNNLQVKIYENKLIFTGRSGSTIGVPVLGADGCTFNPKSTYKDGDLVEYDLSSTSYTVPSGNCIQTFVPGDRHICGNLEEQCDSDNDCGGHTYGNQECIGRQLQTYGCIKSQMPYFLESYGQGYAFEPFEVANEDNTVNNLPSLSRCEIISSRQVQCCGDTDCGSNAFCDRTTFTCEETAECSRDSDCGVSIQCDRDDKTLKKPVCNNEKCEFEVTKEVDCCYDNDCASGYFCDSDYDCKESATPKTDCPFECCVEQEGYFDRPCSYGEFCINGVCVNEGCTKDSDCKFDEICKNGDCISKSQLECSWYETIAERSELDYSWYNYLGIGDPKVVQVTTCATAGWVFGLIVGVVVLLLGLAIIYIWKPNKRRKKR